MHLEIDTLDELDAWLQGYGPDGVNPRLKRVSTGAASGVAVQGLDLTGRIGALASMPMHGVVFLGCTMPEEVANELRARGALVFPRLPEVPFDAYRNALHTATELYAGLDEDYTATPDAEIYAWTRTPAARELQGSLAQALHDHAVTDALDELVDEVDATRCVGIMGGHAAERGSKTYREAALLGARLASSGRVVMTGGGPGAMEAANLGARLTTANDPVDEERLAAAIDLLAQVPRFTAPEQGGQGITAWARQGFSVIADLPVDGLSIGIPTWFYGHEPPNVFATHVAKYFSNAIREDMLLQHCRGGIIYLTGAAGTVQEVFQAATGNYYVPAGTTPTPMVLVGVEHWTQKVPAWPLLQALGAGRAMGERIHLVDTLDEAMAVLTGM